MLQSLRSMWRRWRESRRQYRLERAIYKKEHPNVIRKIGGGGP
jgi:hypothetical protein